MRIPRFHLQAYFVGTLFIALVAPRASSAQQAGGSLVFKTDARTVLVDTVVTDKKGVPIRDLAQKDFRVFEDGKEQVLRSFSFESEKGNSSNATRRYLVLFFDNASMSTEEQVLARSAAARFVDADAGFNRLMAVVNYGGTLHVSAQFTDDVQRLKQVITGIKQSPLQTNPSQAAVDGGFSDAVASFASRDVLSALRRLAEGLRSVPGRKTVIFLSSGFPLTPELTNHLTATIAACNRSNVAVYALDVRGLTVDMRDASHSQNTGVPLGNGWQGTGSLVQASSSYTSVRLHYATLSSQQRGGTGSAGTGGSKGGGITSPARPTAPARSSGSYPFGSANRPLIPVFPTSSSTNQSVLFALADGTGGFLIKNTNDLVGGLQKIERDLNQYYLLSYTPPESKEGQCHTLKVKVARGGTEVRARSGYCNVKPLDSLAGKLEARELEARASSELAGSINGAMQAPYFYTQPNVARVNLVMDIPANALKTVKEKGKFTSTINVLGLAYRPDKSVAARFSDTVNLHFEDKKEMEEALKRPIHFEKEFEIGSGEYLLTVVFASEGESFGKLQAPLNVEPYDGKQFAISGIALSDRIVKFDDTLMKVETGLLEDRTPLTTMGLELVPQARANFKKGASGFIYVELYDSQIAAATPNKTIVAMEYKILDRKSGENKLNSGLFNVSGFVRPNDPVVRVALKLHSEQLPAGDYIVTISGKDFAGQQTPEKRAEFDVE